MGIVLGTNQRRTIAVMQPYFIPYAGYFRLLAATDLFVIYDCVQFARRGWLHRNKLRDATGNLDWLTLPLKKAPQEILIKDIEFREDARNAFLDQARRFPALEAVVSGGDSELSELLLNTSGLPIDYISRLLKWSADKLEIPWTTVRSSTLAIDPAKRGEDRILAIAAALNATSYVNAPGGVELYDPNKFDESGIELRFLPAYQGPHQSILERILMEEPPRVRSEIYSQLI